MSDALLKEHLENLHAELKNTQNVDENTEKLLSEIVEDVQTLLSHKGGARPVHHTTIKDRLDGSAREFDVSHPKLASTMRTVVSTLNNLGI
jgi:hypothetical protein